MRRSRACVWPLKIRRLQHSKLPILVGPFYGEVGFEILYWIPWLHKIQQMYGLDAPRLIPITRGGAAVWYGWPKALELYAMRSTADVRIANKLSAMRTGMIKQQRWTPFDRGIIADAATTLGLGPTDYHTLHPHWMYHALTPFWATDRGLSWLDPRTRYGPIPVSPIPDTVALPKDYVAMSFYARATLRDDPQVRSLIAAILTTVSAHVPVVVLDGSGHADDHWDLWPKELPANVHRLSAIWPTTTETTLSQKSAVMARARGFVGTYGGICQLAARLGRPTVGFYQQWGGTSQAHRHLSQALALAMQTPFLVLPMSDLLMINQVVPHVVLTPIAKGLDDLPQSA